MKLASVRGSQLTESGIAKSTDDLDAPIWRDGQNVVFRNLGPEKIGGWNNAASITTPASEPRGAIGFQDGSGNQYFFTGTKDKIYMWDGTTLTTEGTGYAGNENQSGTQHASVWSFARWGNWMAATNGVDTPQIWKATTFTALGGTPPSTAEILITRGPHMVAFNTDQGIDCYEWTDLDDVEDWVPTSTNAAGSQQIRDMNGPIIAAVNYGKRIAVLGKDDMYFVDYVGSPFYFPYNPAVKGIGAVGKAAVVEAGRILFGLSEDGFWMSDGNTFEFIDQPMIESEVKDNWDTSQLSKTTCDYDSFHKMVTWSVPTTANSGEPGITVGYQWQKKAWTILGYDRTASAPQMGAFSVPMKVKSDGKIFQHNTGTDDDGSGMTSYIQTKPMDFGEPDTWKYVDRIKTQMRKLSGTVQVRIGYQEHTDDSISWESYQTLDDGFEPLDFRSNGVYISLEIRSTATSVEWAMSGFDVHGEVEGMVG